ncbi:MAG: hypothetical protein IJU26_05370 [Synergistaceae bacterium]|nr:hypothetical protein [Synergistaceae bacterium]
MNPDVISCIPSKSLREYLKSHPHTLSILQQATIISAYADDTVKHEMFRRLIEESDSGSEKLLLTTELADPEAACEVYRQHFPHKGFPLYPFLEVCNLPVLFRPADIIRRQNTFYYVGSVPYLHEGRCDFSDECYMCYSLPETLSWDCTHYSDLVHVHYHIGVCEADRADYNRLNSAHKKAANIIRKILAHKKTGRHFRQPAQNLTLYLEPRYFLKNSSSVR